MKDFSSLQMSLNYTFNHLELLQKALTHTSFANECGIEHNERLEFLGDAVLELCVSSELFTRFKNAREGDLTRLRSLLVSSKALANIAQEISIDKYLKLGKGEESQGGRTRHTVLSDAFEAVLGAVFEDGGYDAANAVISHVFKKHWPTSIGYNPHKDYKTLLQELTQRSSKARPKYILKDTYGPEHAKVFEVFLSLPDGQSFVATGQSLKRAEQEAAHMALNALKGE